MKDVNVLVRVSCGEGIEEDHVILTWRGDVPLKEILRHVVNAVEQIDI